jgi:hypothetical protein
MSDWNGIPSGATVAIAARTTREKMSKWNLARLEF